MTPAQRMGYKVGDKFTLRSDYMTYEKGSTVKLVEDDGSIAPLFTNGAERRYVHMKYVEPVDVVRSKIEAMQVKIDEMQDLLNELRETLCTDSSLS